MIDQDEQPLKANLDKIPTLRSAFSKDGTITAANSSSISDGAAALVLSTEDYAQANDLNVLAKIVATSSHSQHPSEFTIAPISAIQKYLIVLAGQLRMSMHGKSMKLSRWWLWLRFMS